MPRSDERLSARVTAALRERLLSGAVPAGTRLTERQIAKELGVSPTPAREAISRLEHEGLVEVIPRVGAIVRETSPDRILQLFEVREALECKAVSLLVVRKTDADVAVLRELAELRDELRPPEHSSSIYGKDYSFHSFILGRCGNAELARVVETLDLIGQCLAWTTFLRSAPGHSGFVNQPTHLEIAEAVADGDSKLAESVMAEHIRAAARAVSMAAALSRLSVVNGREKSGQNVAVSRHSLGKVSVVGGKVAFTKRGD